MRQGSSICISVTLTKPMASVVVLLCLYMTAISILFTIVSTDKCEVYFQRDVYVMPNRIWRTIHFHPVCVVFGYSVNPLVLRFWSGLRLAGAQPWFWTMKVIFVILKFDTFWISKYHLISYLKGGPCPIHIWYAEITQCLINIFHVYLKYINSTKPFVLSSQIIRVCYSILTIS